METKRLHHSAFVLWAFSLPLLASGDPTEFFKERVRPILTNQCFSCHTGARMGGLQLDSLDRILKGGNSGPAVVPGNPEASLLIRAVSYTHDRFKMPPAGKLEEQAIADLRTWVKDGAHWYDAAAAPPSTGQAFTITPEQKAFWAFQPLRKLAPKSSIDHYILSALKARGLEPVRPAEKRTLIRRATFDLIGLPPSPEETDAFVKDASPDGLAKVVDRLLASPRFGERWGRHWLDVARYGEDDAKQPGQQGYRNAWRYRDWVISAFNQDMPYDLFVKAQIAGDLLDSKNGQKLEPGLGFFALGPWPYDNLAAPQQRANERDVRVDGLGKAFLGLTVACARCHDHKLDPISMKDYYALAGVFASTDYREYPLVPKSVVDEDNRYKEKVKHLDTARREFLDTLKRQVSEIQTRKIARYLLAAWKVMGPTKIALDDAAQQEKLDKLTLERWVAYLAKRDHDHPFLKPWDEVMASGGGSDVEMRRVADHFQAAVMQVLAEKKKVDDENQRILSRTPKGSTKIIGPNGYRGYECNDCALIGEGIALEQSLLWRDLYLPFGEKGIFAYDEKELEPFLHPEWKNHLATLKAEVDALKKAQPAPYPFVMGLAESDQPTNLKVNLRGNALQLGEEAPRRFLAVLSDGDPAPFRRGSGRLELAEAILAHPLAARVMANRIWQHLFGDGIVRTPSNFGQLGDRPSHSELLDYLAARFKADGWSMKALIREIMLSATYQLASEHSNRNSAIDPDNRLLWRMNRKRLDVEELRDSLLFVAGSLDLKAGGPPRELNAENRTRTVYGKVSRYKLDGKLSLFDFPHPEHSSEKRTLTNIPLQGLFFLNSELILTQSETLAGRLERESGADDRAKIQQAHRLLYGRDANDADLEVGIEYLGRLRAASVEKSSVWPRYAQVLLSALEFRYVD